jgi:dTDP-glucose 4,6-dehydratase
VIVTSTSEVYGTALYQPIDEKHPLQAQSPYSASKIAADMMSNAYFRSFDIPVTILRPFNTYGPRQSARAVIPTIISQALKCQKEIRLGSLSPKRDMTFVTDTARAFLLAGEIGPKKLSGQVLHFGTGKTFEIGEIAQRALKAAGSSAEIVVEEERIRPEKSEVGLLISNWKMAKEALGWEPEIELDRGLELVVEHIENNLSHFQTGQYIK